MGTVSAQMIAEDQQYLNQQTVQASNVSAKPTINTTNIDNSKQYMTIPLSYQWLKANHISYQINEWWIYTPGEKEIHGITNHKSIDYAVPYGTPVYAPVDGFVQWSYYNTTYGATGDRVMYQNQTINYGLWYRAQIIHPDPSDPLNPDKVTFIQLAHLSRFSPTVAKTIKGSEYIYDPVEDAMKIDNYSLTYNELAFVLRGQNIRTIAVKQWDLIWYAGNSGLEQWENVDEDYSPKTHVYDPQNSRDDAHIHVQTYQRNTQWGKISSSIQDLYHLWTWATGPEYPNHNNWWVLTSWHMFKTMDARLPDYAK